MKKLLFTTFCLLTFAGLFGQKWEEIGNGMNFPNGTPSVVSIGGLTPLNPTTIFAYGRNTFIVSRDAGVNWDSIPIPFQKGLKKGFNIYDIKFFDQNYGIASGDSMVDSVNYQLNKPLLLKTIDGGHTWNQVYLPITLKNFSDQAPIISISFKDSNDFLIGNRKLFGTRDGGKSWTSISFTDSTIGPWRDGLNYFDDSTIFMRMSLSKRLYYSENYGKTWTIDSLTDLSTQKTTINGQAHFEPGKKLGFIIGGADNSSTTKGPMFFTTNGGKNWKYFGGNYPVQATVFDFLDSANGWLTDYNTLMIYRFQRLTDSTFQWNADTTGYFSLPRSGPPIVAMATPTLSYMVISKPGGSYRVMRNGAVSQGPNTVSGKVYLDVNLNNLFDSLVDITLTNVTIMAQPGNYFTSTDKNGNYSFQVDSGSYTFTFLSPSNNLVPSVPSSGSFTLTLTNGQSINNKHFALKPANINTMLSVNISTGTRRRCSRSQTVITYRNMNYASANNVKVALVLPETVKLVSADKSYTADADGRFIFTIGTLGGFESGTIHITDSIICGNEKLLRRTVCSEAYIFADSLNYKTDTAAWDKSEVIAKAHCINGWINFKLINTTSYAMGDSAELRFFTNATLKDTKKYKLGANDTLNLTIQADNNTWRIEADQRPGHPLSLYAQATIEGCDLNDTGLVNLGFVNKLPVNDFKHKKSVDCGVVRGSYDPNDKTVYPEGLTANNYLKPGTPLTYRIRFQNTGNDTAFKVVVKDTLSPHMDLASFRFLGASHPYIYSITGKGYPVLEVTFNNINLPDSTTDNPGSNGFFVYTVQHKSAIAQGSKIDNTAHIYFDFNSAIVTNTASVTITDTSFISIAPVTPVTEFPFILKDYTKDTLCIGDTITLAIIGEGPYNWFEISNPSVSLGTGFELQKIAQATATYIGQAKNGFDTLQVLVKSCTTGPNNANELLKDKISVYPNPSANGFYTILIPENAEEYAFKVIDLTGRPVGRVKEGTIDISQAKPGVYILIITASDNTIWYHKLVKE